MITRDEIRFWGFNSVGEALVLVPGDYCIDDYLAPDCGVRGITGGQRGYSRVLKVLIDGQSVSFRTDATNFMGPEMIPIELVEQIEVVRGPVSALYGANAFFGAVNVITRQRPAGVKGEPGGRQTAAGVRARFSDQLGAGVSVGYIDAGRRWSTTLGASAQFSDYDNRALPTSSPNLSRYQNMRNDLSRDTHVRPLSTFGRLGLKTGAFDTELHVRYGHVDTIAEFLDFGTLSHQNRFSIYTLDSRLQTRWTPQERISVLGALVTRKEGRARPSG